MQYIIDKLGCKFIRCKETDDIFESINKIYVEIKKNYQDQTIESIYEPVAPHPICEVTPWTVSKTFQESTLDHEFETHESQDTPIENVYEAVAPHPTYEVTPWTV
jgi:hypothetical protein